MLMAKKILRDLIRLQSAQISTGEMKAMNRVNSFQDWGYRFILGACAIGGAITLTGCFAIAFSGNRVLAQVTPDGTLGTQVGANGNNFDITGGTRVGGTNVFHSFGSFSIPAGGSANFTDVAGFTNIFGRVTGGTPSDIQGTIRAVGSANLFLINPSGIIFGPNARLDIGGSFVGTTANAIRFPNGGEFSMTSPVDPNNTVLTFNPSALFFNQTPGQIVNQSIAPNSTNPTLKDGLRVRDGQNLFLIGGDVRLENGGTVRALGGRIELGGLAGTGEVKIEDATDNGSNPQLKFPNVELTFPDGVTRANVSLTNGAIVDVVALGGGDIAINAQNITVSGESFVCGGIGTTGSSCNTPPSTFSTAKAQAGNIVLDATEAVNITTQSQIENNVNPGATGNPDNIFDAINNDTLFGSILIQAGSISTDNSRVSASTFGTGSAGLVYFKATDSVVLTNNSFIDSGVAASGIGDAGGILIEAGSIAISKVTTLTTETNGQGNGGVTYLKASGDVSITDSGTFVSSNVEPGATGETRGVRVDARSFFMSGGAEIQALTRGNGSAGTVLVNATDVVDFTGVSPDGFSTGLFTSTEGDATGDGGLIEVNAGTLKLSNAAVLSARTQTAGAGGGILVNVDTLKLLDGGQILATAYSSGASGAILINAKDKIDIRGSDPTFIDRALQLYNNYVAQYGEGQALKLFLQTFDNIPPGSSGIFANVILDSTAEAGGILIVTKDMFIWDKGTISVDNPGPQKAGDIIIIGRDLIMKNQGTINARAISGNGGNIVLAPNTFLLLLENSRITTESGFERQPGSGGNVTIGTKYIIGAPFNNNDIRANAYGEGSGGNIKFTANRLYDIQERKPPTIVTNDITASSAFGLDGTITSNVINADPTQGLANLPANPIDPSTLISEACAPRGGITERQINKFTVTGRGGLPPDPNAAFTGEAEVNDLGTPDEEEQNNTNGPNSTNPNRSAPAATASPQQPEMVEAQGWVYAKNGDIIFTAQAPNITPNNPALTPASTCNAISNSPQ